MHPERGGWIRRWFFHEAATLELEQTPWLRVEPGQRVRLRLPPEWPPTYDDARLAVSVRGDDGATYVATLDRLPPPPPPARPRPRIVYSKP